MVSLKKHAVYSTVYTLYIIGYRPSYCELFTAHIPNPILHTAWLNIHTLALKRNTAKHYFGEKSSFLHTFL
jgi:hypothetical protein